MDHDLTKVIKNESRRRPTQQADQTISQVVLARVSEPLLRPRQINLWIHFLFAGDLIDLVRLGAIRLADAFPPKVGAITPRSPLILPILPCVLLDLFPDRLA